MVTVIRKFFTNSFKTFATPVKTGIVYEESGK